jgi:hypothetical protein
MTDLAPPAHEMRQGDARNAVGQQEVQVFLEHGFLEKLLNFHCLVIEIE